MEKAVKKNKPSREKGMMSDMVLRILAIISAIIIWFALSITQYPTVNKTITDVPVDFSMSGTTAESRGLSALGYQDISVDVEIQGMNYEIGAYTANDLSASVNLDSVTKEGTYELDIDVKSTHSTDQCTIISVSPETVEVQFDRIASTTMPVTVSAPNVSAEDGFMLKETAVSTDEIEIEGAENELENLAKVVAVYTDSATISDDMTVTSDSLLLYDADDNLLDSSLYTLSQESVDITFVVYKKVTATLEPTFTDTPPGFDVDSLPYTLSQETIQLVTPQLDAASTETLKLSPVALYDVSKGKTFKTEIASILSTGEENQSGVEQVELSFDFSDYSQKTLVISSDNVTITNAPSGKTVTLDSEQISNVVIFGPSDVVDDLTVDDLTAEIDLSDVSANGSVSHAITIYSKKYNTVWNIGTHEVVVTVSDEEAQSAVTEVDSSSSSD
ncbi:MAG: hypothetical protein LUI06_05175 [Ruminococcus sp.]|nr:hypothetical protein [Ruminococcus sp.]